MHYAKSGQYAANFDQTVPPFASNYCTPLAFFFGKGGYSLG